MRIKANAAELRPHRKADPFPGEPGHRGIRFRMVLFLCFFSAAAGLCAQGVGGNGASENEDLLTTVSVEAAEVQAGQSFRLFVRYLFPEEMYQSDNRDFFTIKIAEPEEVEVLRIDYPEGIRKNGKTLYRGETLLSALILIPGTVGSGELRLTVAACYQLCDNEGQCFFPKREEHEVLLDVTAASSY